MDANGNGTPKPPSKVEAIKLASEFLKVQVAAEAFNGLSHFSEDAATVLKFHGSLPAGRPRPPDLAQAGREGEGVFDDGPGPDARRQMHRRAVPGRRRAGHDRRQRHDPDHHPPGVPAPRRPQGRHGGDDPPDQRGPALDPGRLRRRRAERPRLPRADPRRGPRRDPGRRRRLHLALRPPGVELLRRLARRREGRQPPAAPRRADPGARPRATTRSSRSTGGPTSPGSSRPPSPCPRTTAPTSWPTTWATWPSSRGGDWSATTSWSAAAWARPRAPSKTFPALAQPLCYVDRADFLAVGEAVMKVYRDHGNRSDRKRARIKYLVHDWGMPAFRPRSRSTSAAP